MAETVAQLEARIAAIDAAIDAALAFKTAGEEGGSVTNHDPDKLQLMRDKLQRRLDALRRGGTFARGRVVGLGAGR